MAETKKEEVLLYDGKIKAVFYPDSHQYRIDGKRLPSVTGITGIIDKSTALINWAVGEVCGYLRGEFSEVKRDKYHPDEVMMMIDEAQNEWRKKRDQAADLGTAIHCALQGIEYDGVPPTKEQEEVIAKAVDAFNTWLTDTGRTILAVERTIYHDQKGYVGRLDMVVDSKERGVEILDIKSSSGIYPEMKAQVAAYVMAWNREFEHLPDMQAKGALIAHIDKQEGNVIIHPIEELDKACAIFDACLSLTNALKAI